MRDRNEQKVLFGGGFPTTRRHEAKEEVEGGVQMNVVLVVLYTCLKSINEICSKIWKQ
jgi:hypothetical protein